MKYHITDNGEVKRCIAFIRPCKYGCHFSSVEQGNRVNDLVYTQQADNQREAKAMVLLEQYRAFGEASKTFRAENTTTHYYKTYRPSNAYKSELESNTEKIKELKEEILQLKVLNRESYDLIDKLENNRTKKADQLVITMFEESLKTDERISYLEQEVRFYEFENEQELAYKKKSDMYYKELYNQNDDDIQVREAISRNGKTYIGNVEVDRDGRIMNLYLERDNKLQPIFEITPDRRFLTYDFAEVNTSNGKLITISQKEDVFECIDMVL